MGLLSTDLVGQDGFLILIFWGRFWTSVLSGRMCSSRLCFLGRAVARTTLPGMLLHRSLVLRLHTVEQVGSETLAGRGPLGKAETALQVLLAGCSGHVGLLGPLLLSSASWPGVSFYWLRLPAFLAVVLSASLVLLGCSLPSPGVFGRVERGALSTRHPPCLL